MNAYKTMENLAVLPRVSVLVAVYRPECDILRETIRAVLAQTFADFELLLQDDCPDDPREDVANEFRDERIRYERNERNLGISETRNRLMDRARGEYLAVLDHDDVCHVDRLEKEVAYLDRHPECGVVSSFTREVPSGNVVERPISDADIRVMMMGGCVVAHSAAMIRASVLQKANIRYEPEFTPSEDLRLFLRLLSKTQFYAIPEPLLDYRIHDQNATKSMSQRMWNTAERAIQLAKAEYPDLCHAYDIREDKVGVKMKTGTLKHSQRGIFSRLFNKIKRGL